MLLTGVVVIAGGMLWEAATWPNVAGLAARPPTTTAFIERYKERERAAGRSPQVALVWTPYAAIPWRNCWITKESFEIRRKSEL